MLEHKMRNNETRNTKSGMTKSETSNPKHQDTELCVKNISQLNINLKDLTFTLLTTLSKTISKHNLNNYKSIFEKNKFCSKLPLLSKN